MLADIHMRDERDSGRPVAPLCAADDAVELDTSELDIAGAVAAAIRIAEERLAKA